MFITRSLTMSRSNRSCQPGYCTYVKPPKIVVIGGVAGGATAAAKARRTNQHCDITVFEKGPYVSFANCGLPYYVGGDIKQRQALLLETPQGFWDKSRIKVNVRHEVTDIVPKNNIVKVKNLETNESFEETYDKLILCPGAGAIIPNLPGVDSQNIFSVKTVPDTDKIKQYVQQHKPKTAVVVGAGFIGLESAEALFHLGIKTTIVEWLDHIIPSFDGEFTRLLENHIRNEGIDIRLQQKVIGFEKNENGMCTKVLLENGQSIDADLVIMSIGVRPEIGLAQNAGLKIGKFGGIVVNNRQQTSERNIFAAGDACEVHHAITMKSCRMALAGPANKQGRVAGANAAGGSMSYGGSIGTSIVECMGLTAGITGLTERQCQIEGIDYLVSIVHPNSHVGYYPGAHELHIKLIHAACDGRILGVQIVGTDGVDKRVDVIATAIQGKLKVSDLENLDLAYSPQYGSANDPIVLASFVASNQQRGEVITKQWKEIEEEMKTLKSQKRRFQLIDVRDEEEFGEELPVDGAMLIPLPQLQIACERNAHSVDSQSNEMELELNGGKLSLSKTAPTFVYCTRGLRGYKAYRMLTAEGFTDVVNIVGGLHSHN